MMATEQQIEVVAQAIQRAFAGRSRQSKPREWSGLPERVRVDFRTEAAAAIEANDAFLRTQK